MTDSNLQLMQRKPLCATDHQVIRIKYISSFFASELRCEFKQNENNSVDTDSVVLLFEVI